MRYDVLLARACGYEEAEGKVRVYVEGPVPTPSFSRRRGVRSPLFHLFAGEEAEALKAWLSRHRAWQAIRVPLAYSRERGVRALLVAANWHGGERSALFSLARTRQIRDHAHRERLLTEVWCIIDAVIENPERDGELDELQLLEDVLHTAPAGVELATTAEFVDAHFGAVR